MAKDPRRPKLRLRDKIAIWLDLPPDGVPWKKVLSNLIPAVGMFGFLAWLLLRASYDPQRLSGYQRARVTEIATQLGGETTVFSVTAELADGTPVRFIYRKRILMFGAGDEICLARFVRLRSGQSVFAYTDDTHCADLPRLPTVEPF